MGSRPVLHLLAQARCAVLCGNASRDTRITRHTSYITHHTPHIIHHTSHITSHCPHLEQLDEAGHHHVTRQLVRGPLRRVTECGCSRQLQPPGKILHTNTSNTMADGRYLKPITFDDMSPTSAVTIDLRVCVTRHACGTAAATLTSLSATAAPRSNAAPPARAKG